MPPLVSVIVTTYNSSRFVLETLESAYRQTYPDIELIVSDDCSTDDTLALCQRWVSEHTGRFRRALCTQTPRNLGIVGNCNHAMAHATGQWLKYIAGDDLLLPNCVERLVAHIRPKTYLYSCGVHRWEMRNNRAYYVCLCLPDTCTWRQARLMLKNLYLVPGPGLFVQRDRLASLGGFDTRFNTEDQIIVTKYLTLRQHVGVIHEPLVVWRIHGDNTSEHPFSPIMKPLKWQFYKAYVLRYCWRYALLLHGYHYFVDAYLCEYSRRCGLARAAGYLLRAFDILQWLPPMGRDHLNAITVVESKDFVPPQCGAAALGNHTTP